MGYLDPGLFGMISQVGLVVLLALVSGFMFFFNPIKRFFKKLTKKEETAGESENTPADPEKPSKTS